MFCLLLQRERMKVSFESHRLLVANIMHYFYRRYCFFKPETLSLKYLIVALRV